MIPEVPQRLKANKTFKGYVVPYSVLIGDDGTPDFKVTDMEKWVEVLSQRKCALCGQLLDYWLYFLGGPQSCANSTFFDPAMHKECMEYAIEVCPYMHGKDYSEHLKEHPHVTLSTHPVADSPDKMGIYKCRRYRYSIQDSVIFAGPAVSITYFERKQNAAR
jgi:hypothetical protein